MKNQTQFLKLSQQMKDRVLLFFFFVCLFLGDSQLYQQLLLQVQFIFSLGTSSMIHMEWFCLNREATLCNKCCFLFSLLFSKYQMESIMSLSSRSIPDIDGWSIRHAVPLLWCPGIMSAWSDEWQKDRLSSEKENELDMDQRVYKVNDVGQDYLEVQMILD